MNESELGIAAGSEFYIPVVPIFSILRVDEPESCGSKHSLRRQTGLSLNLASTQHLASDLGQIA